MFRFAWLVVFSLSAVPLAAQTAAPKFAPVEARLVQARMGWAVLQISSSPVGQSRLPTWAALSLRRLDGEL